MNVTVAYGDSGGITVTYGDIHRSLRRIFTVSYGAAALTVAYSENHRKNFTVWFAACLLNFDPAIFMSSNSEDILQKS